MQKTLVVRLLTYTVGSRPLVLYVVSYLKTTVFSTPSASVWFQTRHHHSSRGREQAREIPLERGGRGWGGGGLLQSTEQPPLWWNSFINGSNCTRISQDAANRGESRQGEKGTPSSCAATTQPLAAGTDGEKNKKQTGKRVRQQQRWGRSGNGERRPLSLIRCTAHRK